MNLAKLEKIQFVYDLLGTLFCALFLGVVCAFFAESSSHQTYAESNYWAKFHFYVPVLVYSSFFYLFWRNERFKRFRLNFNWLFVSISSVIFTFPFTFLLRDLNHQRLFTAESKFVPAEIFIGLLGISVLSFTCLMFCFWVFGLIHRVAVGNDNRVISLNLCSNKSNA